MLSPSDYNDAVPQFTNGNYANTPLNPLYIEEPDAVNYNRGTEPIQTLPAQWWNWLMNQITTKLNKLNIYVKNIFDELAQLLSLVSVTPDGTEGDITTGQLKDMFQTKYPVYLQDNFTSDEAIQNSKLPFSAGGMYKYTANSSTSREFLAKIFARLLPCYWDAKPASEAPYGVSASSVVYGNGIFNVALEGKNVNNDLPGLYWSIDGKTWVPAESEDAEFYRCVFNCVLYADNMWVAGASNNGGAWYSSDGKTWAHGDKYFSSRTCLYYANGLWQMGADSGFYWSEDGMTWTLSNGANYIGLCMCYNDGMWVAGCGNGYGIYWSTDGKNWTQGTGGLTYQIQSIDCGLYYSSKRWVVATFNKGAWYSSDGKAWTQSSNFNTEYVGVVRYRNNMWVAGFRDGICYSVDGQSWTRTNLNTGASALAYINGVWIAGNNTNGIFWSEDGMHWMRRYSTRAFASSQISSIAYGNGTIVAVGTGHPSIIYAGVDLLLESGDICNYITGGRY